MNELRLNNTPVRTARNFNVNDITVEYEGVDNIKKEFKNTKITGIGSNVILEDTICSYTLKYGTSKFLEEEVLKKANQTLRLNVKEKANIDITNIFDKDNMGLVGNIEINAERQTNVNIIIKYKAQDDLKYYHNSTIRLFARKDSKVNIIIVNMLNTKSNNFLSIESDIEENAIVNYTIIDFGGKNSITNYYGGLVRSFCK